MKNKLREKDPCKKLEGKLLVVEVEERGRIRKLELKENQICLEGFRKMRGKYIRGVPKRSHSDCFKYCLRWNC